MKIGIITLHGENNYGAALQTVALKMFLDRYGDVNVINYSSDLGVTPFSSIFIEEKPYAKQKLDTTMFRLLEQEREIKKAMLPLERVYKFNKFIKTYANITKAYSYKELQEQKMEVFDVYVSGSDQIWNPRLTGMDSVFFSHYAPQKVRKISYASSIGNYEFDQNEATLMREYLSDFTHISTREKDAIKILENISGKEITCVLDPVLLLTKKEWKRKFKIKEIAEPYILVYNMYMNPKIFEIAHTIAEKRKVKIFNIRNWHCASENIESNIYIDKHFTGAGPLEFLELFYNASFIITDSFHGTAFSINFNKDFLSVLPAAGPSRIKNLLNLVGLKERLITNMEELKRIKLEIDYLPVNILLTKERNESIKYLANALVD